MFTPELRHRSGAASELYVAYRLIQEGFEVFSPLMTQSKADFLALKEGVVLKVQVKKASWSKAGKYSYLQSRIHGSGKRDPNKRYTADDVDFFAITDNDKVWWIPYNEIGHQSSVCLGSSNPEYRQYTKYDATKWLL